MTTIAAVGAGPGLGAAVARRFAAEGLSVALVSRTQEHVDDLARTLAAEGATARGYAADVRDPGALGAALDAAAADLGPVEVLQYSPLPARDYLKPVLGTTAADLDDALAFSLHGLRAAVDRVLPGMRQLGRGSVLLANGGSAIRPNPEVAGTSVAFAAEAAYAQMLHEALAPEGVHVGQLIIPGGIEPGHPTHDPAVLAGRLWTMHADRGDFRVLADRMPD